MKKWNKISFIWGQRGHDIDEDKSLLVTNVPIPASGGKFFRLGLLTIASDHFKRFAMIKVHFRDDSAQASLTAYDDSCELNSRVKRFLGYEMGPSLGDIPGYQNYSAKLKSGVEFCDWAINTARGIFESLGIKDPDRKTLSNFVFSQRTYIKRGKDWVLFEDFLREKHKLPSSR